MTTRIAKIKNKWFAHANHILFEQTLNGGLDVLLGDRGLNGFLQGQSRGIDAFHMGEACIEQLLDYFFRYPDYVLFRCGLLSYAVLVKGDAAQLARLTERGLT